ncbi:MAG TPA: Stk1 family PASTA domain-containing Ser/Thr kinase [Firmicutes bacterium]|jgi:serine/threonine protein kinase/beta-lactam-binding protein with PASTA domain|nr:Stk1 family PASTA domain-containing Ser/Thr kinase [Bacillota bacterium]
MVGETLANRYEILEKVGDGGMALVYSAKDHLLSRVVAVKVLRSQFADDEQFVERFRREARSAASLSHPNIVNIYDVGEQGSIHYIVMEYVQGRTLHDLVHEHGPFPQEFVVSVGKQIAMALAHAHYHGIIHRDIKPHNILITAEGRVKVTDFGIAQAMSATNLTQTGVVLGSVRYFSPEQARGANVQAASDLYSLGIVLYEMISGEPPFRGDSAIAIALQQIQDPPEPLRNIRPDLDAELEDLVLKLLNKNPKDRPRDAEDVVRTFQRIERRLVAEADGVGDVDQTLPLPAADLLEKGGWGLAREKKQSKTKKKTQSKKEKAKKAPQKRSKVLVLLVIFLLLGALAAAAVRIIPEILFPDDVRVPDIVGLHEMEALRVLRNVDLVLTVEQRLFDNEVPAGYIISQDPLPGRMVKQYREIAVRVSQGPEEVEMPSFIGLSLREAKVALTQAGFVEGENTEIYDPQVNPGIVLEQQPEPGEIVAKGTAVSLVLSKAAEPFTLPDFRGQDFELVKQQLAALGLPLGNSWPEYSTVYPMGRVIEQNPAPGSLVEQGWPIDFVYSQGAPAVPQEEPKVEETPEETQWIHENLWSTKEVTIDVPPGPSQEIVILVIDDFGAREVYRETHKGGTRVVRTIQGRGKDARFQVYLGGRQFLDRAFQE